MSVATAFAFVKSRHKISGAAGTKPVVPALSLDWQGPQLDHGPTTVDGATMAEWAGPLIRRPQSAFRHKDLTAPSATRCGSVKIGHHLDCHEQPDHVLEAVRLRDHRLADLVRGNGAFGDRRHQPGAAEGWRNAGGRQGDGTASLRLRQGKILLGPGILDLGALPGLRRLHTARHRG